MDSSEKRLTATVDIVKKELYLTVPIGAEVLSGKGKSYVCYNSGVHFTPLEGTNLMYKVVIIRDLKSNSILKEEEDGKESTETT